MRREFRRSQDDDLDTKKILYITGAIFVVAIILLAIVFWVYSANWEEDYQEIGQINSITEDYEETSSSFGKNINEVQNEMESENTVTENNTVDKIAINTSKIEEEVKQENSNNNEEQVEQENVKEEQETNSEVTKEEETKETSKEVANPVFQKPVEGEIIKPFAKTNLVYSNTLGEWIVHNGIDIKADKTTVVKASEAGTVKSIKNDPRYGLTIVIEHSNQYTTVYSNLLSAEFVVVGEEVEQGQTIGTVGNTATFEIADDPHLHFEILYNSEQVDPELYLK